MKVRLIAFQWVLGAGITMPEFGSHLVEHASTGRVFNNILRRVYIQKTNTEYYAGVVLTIRDQKKFLTVSGTGNRLKLTRQHLGGGNKLAECNFFILHPATNRGLYAYYHQSVSVPVFQAILRPYYSELKENRIELEKARLLGSSTVLRKTDEKAAKRAFKGNLKVEMMLNSSSLASILRDLTDIDSFQFNYSRLVPGTRAFRPLRGVVKNERIHVTFKPAITSTSRRTSITKAVREGLIQKGIVRGKDGEGNTKSVPVQQNPDVYEEWDFDEYAEQLDFTISDLNDAEPVQQMIDVADENAGYFKRLT